MALNAERVEWNIARFNWVHLISDFFDDLILVERDDIQETQWLVEEIVFV